MQKSAALALLCALALSACRTAPPPAPEITQVDRPLHRQSFEYVWQTVRDKHWDPTLNGVDWQKVHDEFLPRVEAAKTGPEVAKWMNEMLSRLGQSHFGVMDAAPETASSGDAPIGIDFRMIAGEALVTRVTSSDPRTREIRPGWKLLRIRDKAVAEIVEEVHPLPPLLAHRAIAARLAGRAGEIVPLAFLDASDREVRVDTPCDPPGEMAEFGYVRFPNLTFEARELDGGIGYITFNLFMTPKILEGYNSAIERFRAAPGIIIDLRGNPGGIAGFAAAMAGWLIEFEQEGASLGTMNTREDKLNLVINPRLPPYRGKVAVIIDELSASTSEIFAAGLRDLGRARVFGVRSAGAALPSIIEALPNGQRFQYAIANFVTSKGTAIEGIGVEPDVETPLTRAALLRGEDVALDAAVAWIHSELK